MAKMRQKKSKKPEFNLNSSSSSSISCELTNNSTVEYKKQLSCTIDDLIPIVSDMKADAQIRPTPIKPSSTPSPIVNKSPINSQEPIQANNFKPTGAVFKPTNYSTSHSSFSLDSSMSSSSANTLNENEDQLSSPKSICSPPIVNGKAAESGSVITTNPSEIIVKNLFKQLENQQLTNFILKNQIAAVLEQKNQVAHDQMLPTGIGSSSTSTSVSTTSTNLTTSTSSSMNTTPTLNQQLSTCDEKSTKEIILTEPNEEEEDKDTKANNIVHKKPTKQAKNIKILSSNGKFKSKLKSSLKIYKKISHKTNGMALKESEQFVANDGTCQSLHSPKTPKSALLEKRRKAVFELLTQEIYPSGQFFYFTTIQVYTKFFGFILYLIIY